MPCPSCGRDNATDARFCSNCGAALTGASAERHERKVVTVLFADLVGSTARAEQTRPGGRGRTAALVPRACAFLVALETSEFERTGHAYLGWEARLGLVWLCVHHGYGPQLVKLLDATPRWQIHSAWRDMMQSIRAGDLRSAAAVAESHLLLADAALLRLKGGVDVERALAFYREAGAPRYVREAEELVAA